MNKTEHMNSFYFSSPLGLLEVCTRGERLLSILKSNKKAGSSSKSKLSPLERQIKSQLQAYFKGQLKKFDIPLRLAGSPTQKRVWKELQKIPYGKTISYGELASKINLPKGARFIGQCCAKNPCLILIPCHRVLSQKDLGGFALGLKAKKTLLSIEAKLH